MVEMVQQDLLISQLLTRKSLINTIRTNAAIG
jgi:dihydroxyacid dehydratase/phosphogluconate dehydratase